MKVTLFRSSSIILLVLISFVAISQREIHIGISYNYGAAFNFHNTNKKPWPPGDVSVPSLFFHLDAGKNKLGIRASLGLRREDIRYHILDRFYLKQTNSGIELKLQCLLPITDKSTIALGFAPRLLFRSYYETEYKNELNNTFYGQSTFIPEDYNGLNKINSSLAFSWYYDFAKRWQASFHLDYDVLNIHRDDIGTAFLFDESAKYEERYINARLTSLALGLAFLIK